MFTSDNTPPAEPRKQAWLPLAFALPAIIPVVALAYLIRQPKEVVAAVYSAYVAAMAVLAGAVFERKKKRGAAIAALVTCLVFASLFVVYAYMAYKR